MSARKWASQVYGDAELGDLRRTKRLVNVAAIMACCPLSGFSQAFQQWGQTKAAYRLMANEAVSSEALTKPLTKTTVRDSRGQKVVLAVSDTTSLNFTNHRATSGLGTLGTQNARGLFLHSTIALRPDGVPFGLLSKKAWIRPPEEYGKKRTRNKRPIEDKESYRWVQSISQAAQAMDDLPEDERPYIIHIFDREGDIQEVFEEIERTGDGAVIRSAQNRLVAAPKTKTEQVAEDHRYLHSAVLNSNVFGQEEIEVPRKQGQAARRACVEYRACQVTLQPAKKHAIQRNRQELIINVVSVTETNPPQGVPKPLEWILLTTEPIDNLSDIKRIVGFYQLRWRIEEYHLVLKSGCRIEKIQFESLDRILKVLSIFAGIAMRILQITYTARVEPDKPCTVLLTEDQWRALQTKIQGKPPTPNARPPTLKQAVLWIGRLGGHLGRRSDGMPGVRVLWRGWRDLEIITSVYQALVGNTN